jgi:alpha-L-rhamnosidase
MKNSVILLSFLVESLLCIAVLTAPTGDITAADLKVEYLGNPLAVDIPQPRLQWTLQATDPTKKDLSQKAYQILVATDRESLDKNIGNLWDSKKVASDRTTHIKYGGTPLKSGQRAYWKVNVWDQNDQVQLGTSEPVNYWDKGLDINDWTAQWVGAPKGTQQKALQNISDIDSKVSVF